MVSKRHLGPGESRRLGHKKNGRRLVAAMEMMDMFRLFRSDPVAKLEKELAAKMEEAVQAQRNGKMPLFAQLTADAEEIGQRLDAARAEKTA